MKADEALLLPAHEIDYESLEEGVLFDLAVQTLEPFIATNALAELSIRGSMKAMDAADTVLAGNEFDVHAKAHALTTLFTHARPRAMEHMRSMLDACTEPKLLGAMVENVMSDLASFGVGMADRDFARALAERVRRVARDDSSDVEEVIDFLSRFAGNLQNGRSGTERSDTE